MGNRIQGTTEVVGLVGDPLKHSRSPHMHNSAFEKLGLDYVYLCFEVPEGQIEDGLKALKTINAKGSNVTFPHKQAVIPYLDDLTDDARLIGAVNTLEIDQKTKKMKGHNTDGRGFIASLDELEVVFRGEKVVLIGCGGAGRAIAVNLALEGVKELVMMDTNATMVDEVKEIIEENIPGVVVRIVENNAENMKRELEDSVLLVNATPLGMKGRDHLCAVPGPEVFNANVFAYDIVYDPRETLFMKYAKEAGCRTANGINMMIWQGAIAFKIWMGVDMPQDYVRQELFEGDE